jgi:hypothetical protein
MRQVWLSEALPPRGGVRCCCQLGTRFRKVARAATSHAFRFACQPPKCSSVILTARPAVAVASALLLFRAEADPEQQRRA